MEDYGLNRFFKICGVIAAVAVVIGLTQMFGTSAIFSIIKYPLGLWGSMQVVRSSIYIITKDAQYIEGLFKSEKSCMIALVADGIMSILGVYCLFEFFW